MTFFLLVLLAIPLLAWVSDFDSAERIRRLLVWSSLLFLIWFTVGTVWRTLL